MSFLPEHDRDFFGEKKISFEEIVEGNPQSPSRGVVIHALDLPPGLFARDEQGVLHPRSNADILIMIPTGYNDTKLDSFYTFPRLVLANGMDPVNCSGTIEFAKLTWQFWSRHQPDGSWRAGIDALDTYLQLIREVLAAP